MSRKTLPEGKGAPKGDSLNSLIKQLEDPRSLMSFLPIDTQHAFASVPEEYLNVDESILLERFKEELNWEPTMITETLRLNFWLEYDRVAFSKAETMMNMSNIYLGVCARAYWAKIVHQPHIVAFILSRPIGYEHTYESLQQLSNRKFHQILSLPVKEGGKLNIKLLELQMKAAAMVDLRNKGGYINRSETKNVTLLSQKTEHSYTHALDLRASNKTAAHIELDVAEKLKQLEEEARTQLPPPEPRFESSKLSDEAIADAEYTDVTKREE